MYGKIFDSIYDGTLRANWKALVTFQQLIVLSDADGIVDMTPYALHGRTGIPIDIIDEGLKLLSEPDPNSRSKDEEGRRIVLINDNRAWGWKLVNHQHYKELRTAEDRREYMQQYMKDYRKNSQTNQGQSKQESLQDFTVNSGKPELAQLADTDTDTDTKTTIAPPGAFERFWSAYPKKKSKGDAKRAWKKIKPDEQLQDRILKAVERAKTSVDWTKDNGKWVPYPASWLNAEGWEDDHVNVLKPKFGGI